MRKWVIFVLLATAFVAFAGEPAFEKSKELLESEIAFELVRALPECKDETTYNNLVRLLVETGKPSVPALVWLIQSSKRPEIQVTSMRILGKFGLIAKEAAPILLSCLDHKDPRIRDAAVSALADIGPDAKQAIPKLTRIAISDPDRPLRISAAFALGRMGPDAAVSIPALQIAAQRGECDTFRIVVSGYIINKIRRAGKRQEIGI